MCCTTVKRDFLIISQDSGAGTATLPCSLKTREYDSCLPVILIEPPRYFSCPLMTFTLNSNDLAILIGLALVCRVALLLFVNLKDTGPRITPLKGISLHHACKFVTARIHAICS